MKKYTYKLAILSLAFLFLQCADDDNDNIIEPDPTCTDGIQNGDETGVDCGGSCPPCDEESIDFSGTFVQEDQVGRPANATFYITYGLRDTYNTTIPSELQEGFSENIQTNIMNLFEGYTENIHGQSAEVFSDFLAADVLWVSQTGTMTYADGTNIFTGRKLQDDVMDYNLLLLFGGPDENNPLNDGSDEDTPLLIRDNVDANDKSFLTTFPYLASPH